MSVKIEITNLKPVAQYALDTFVEERAGLLEAMGRSVKELTVDHLRQLAQTRHRTSSRLGAKPSAHFSQAAEKVAESRVRVGSDEAVVTVNHVGMIRALRSVTITPRSARALAIPLKAEAYNARPAELTARGVHMFVLKGKTTGNAFLAKRDDSAPKGAKPTLLYLLVRKVTQQQDRTLLPSNEEIGEAASHGAVVFIHRRLNEA